MKNRGKTPFMKRQQIAMMLGDLEAKFIDISKMERKNRTIYDEIKLMDNYDQADPYAIIEKIQSAIVVGSFDTKLDNDPEEGLRLTWALTKEETEDEFNQRVQEAEKHNANLTIRKQQAKEYLISLLNEKD